MAIRPITIRLANGRRVQLNSVVDDVTRQQVEAYARAWDVLTDELESTLSALASQIGEGRRLTLQPRQARLNRALDRVGGELDRLAAASQVQITDAAGRAVSVSGEFDSRILASQMPSAAGSQTDLAFQFANRLAPDSIDAVLRRSAQQIASTTRPVPQATLDTIRRELVRGVTIGDNPNVTARRMLSRVEGRFNFGLTRALTIARTETMDAYRQANMAFANANADVLRGWSWFAELDETTCVACVALHGESFPLEEPGPDGHQNCRCTRLDELRPWSELGFDIPEPAPVFPTREEYISGLSPDQRIRQFGAQRDAMLRDGTATLRDFVEERPSDEWRRSFGVRPLQDMNL